MKLFRESNPEAYNELIGVYREPGKLDENIENISAESDLLGKFVCTKSNHKFINYIYKRADPEKDTGCPICQIDELGTAQSILLQKVHYVRGGININTLWVCRECRSLWWSNHDVNHTILSHSFWCEDQKKGNQPLAITHPEISKEYSEDNKIPLEWISVSGWREYKGTFGWKCSTCNNTYEMTLNQRIAKLDNACPYCNKTVPNYEESLAFLYPEIAEEWDCRKQMLDISSAEIWGNRIGRGNTHGIETVGYFKCPDCGIIHKRSIKSILDNEACEFLKSDPDFKAEWHARNNYLILNFEYYLDKKSIKEFYWSCPHGHLYKMSLRQRFLLKKRGHEVCPICQGHRYPKPHFF